MTEIRIKRGVNLRSKPWDILPDQAAYLQNYDMTHDEMITQIQGSSKFHGASLGTNSAKHITVNYNNQENKQDILACVDNKILKKNIGANEFDELYVGLTPNMIKSSVQIEDKTYFAHPVDGLFEYDGVSVVTKVNDILLKDIYLSKETNRAFGLSAAIPTAVVWTDDLSTMGGVPLVWNPLNISNFYPTLGDVTERVWFFKGRLIVFMTNSIWIMYVNGSYSNWRPEKVTTSVGLIAHNTLKQVGSELWFLGYSAETGRGLYAFNGVSVRLLSYDVEPILNRIPDSRIKEACAEYVNNIYKLSFSLDRDNQNNHSFHFDSININPETELPNIYGPHTYGFEASCVLNTSKFKDEHIFSRVDANSESRIYKAGDYRTQYSDELIDNGDLIPTILLSAVIDKEDYKGGKFDASWEKRYRNLFFDFVPEGTWAGKIEVLKGYQNDVFEDYTVYMNGQNSPIESMILGEDTHDQESYSTEIIENNFVSDAIQIKVSNMNVNSKTTFGSVSYDAKPIRRKRNAQIIHI